MKDLTQGSITGHLLHMSAFLALSMLVQTLYLLADLFWVGSLGKEAIAAVSLAGTLMMVVLALTQTLNVGTTTLISHAAGQKDQARAQLAFNQSVALSLLVGGVVAILMFAFRSTYCLSLSADRTTAELSMGYLRWFIPALALQFPMVALAAALRGTGIVKPTVNVQILSVLLNMVIAPLLIFGVGPFPKMGVAGAALATLLAILIANVVLISYFERQFRYLRFCRSQLAPQLKIWWAMLRVGLPAGAEFAMFFVYTVMVYGIIRRFGPAAQAGFGIGARVMQAIFLPTMAVAFALAPIVGQNYSGRQPQRVRQSFYSALGVSFTLMLVLTLLCQLVPQRLIWAFSHDGNVIAFGSEYLRIISWNFVAVSAVFTASSTFQGLGNTLPPLASSLSRILLFALPAVMLSQRPGFEIRQVWYLSLASVIVQAAANLWLVHREFRRKLDSLPAEITPVNVPQATPVSAE